MKKIIPLVLLAAVFLTSCRVSNKQIIRQQHLEEGVENPTTVKRIPSSDTADRAEKDGREMS